MSKAHLPERVFALTVLALLFAERLVVLRSASFATGAGLMIAGWAGAALVGFALSLAARRGIRGRWSPARTLCHALAVLGAALAERESRPVSFPACLAEFSAATTRAPPLWVGRIVGVPTPGPDGVRATVALSGAHPDDERTLSGASAARWQPVQGRIDCTFPGQKPQSGEWWIVRGTLVRPTGRRNPGGFDRARHAERRGIAGIVRIEQAAAARCVSSGGGLRPEVAVARALGTLRARAHDILQAHLKPDAAGLAEAMAVGPRASLVSETVTAFRWLGWSHLVAVSGLNVGFVAALIGAAAGIIRIRHAAWAIAPVLALYAAVSGGEPPVVRATVMAFLALVARSAGRSLGSGRALSLSALLCLGARPGWLFDPSFLLSFGALAGMALFTPAMDWSDPWLVFRRENRFGRWIGLPLLAGIGSQLGCLPILAVAFHWLSPWGVVTGPVIIPVTALFVCATLVALVLGGVADGVHGGALNALLLGGASVLGEAVLALCRLSTAHLGRPWAVGTPGGTALTLFLVALAGLLMTAGHARARAVMLVLALVLAAGLVTGIPERHTGKPVAQVEVVFLDVGQGDSALILLYGPRRPLDRLGFPRRPRYAAVIDTGDHPPGGFDQGAGVVAAALAACGVGTIDAVLLTHADRDHAGGFPGLATWLRIREVIWPAALRVPRAVRARAKEADTGGSGRDLRLTRAAAGDTLGAWPGVTLTVLHPPPSFQGSGNDGSLVVRLEAFGYSVLFLGDLEAAGEGQLIDAARSAELGGAEHRLRAHVVKAGHHGSRTSSTPALVAAVDTDAVLVSCGVGNRFGHPSPEVIERWKEAGAQIWRTDHTGAVRVTMTRDGMTIGPAVEEGEIR